MSILIVLTVAGCGRDTVPAADAALPLRFGVLQSVDHLPYFVMRAKGFDKENGLAITETVAQGGPLVIEGLAKGDLDVGFPGTVPVLNASRHRVVPDAVGVIASVAFADPAHRAFAVVARPEVTTWQDLAGKDVAINQADTIGDAAIRSRLRLEGVEAGRLVPIPFPNQGLAVAGGNVAAAVMVEPFVTQSLQRGDGHVLDWVVGGGEPFVEFEESVVAVSRTFLDRHPDAVRAFLRAELQAVRWIAAHEGEARAILAERLSLAPAVAREMHLVRWPVKPRNDPRLWDAIRGVLVAVAPTPPSEPVSALFDNSLLQQVLTEEGKS